MQIKDESSNLKFWVMKLQICSFFLKTLNLKFWNSYLEIKRFYIWNYIIFFEMLLGKKASAQLVNWGIKCLNNQLATTQSLPCNGNPVKTHFNHPILYEMRKNNYSQQLNKENDIGKNNYHNNKNGRDLSCLIGRFHVRSLWRLCNK